MTGPDETFHPLPAAPPIRTREFDLVVLGASGVTGRLVAAQLAALSDDLGGGPVRWAVAGRDAGRVRSAMRSVGLDPTTIVADTTDAASLRGLTARTSVLLNLAGPYTDTGVDVIAACVVTGTSYVDLCGELGHLQRVGRRFHQPAREAGIAIVPMAGWEALPADLTTLMACRAAAGSDAGSDDGPGAAFPVRDVDVVVRFHRRPDPDLVRRSVSGGTLASIVTMLADPDAAAVGDPAALLPTPTRPADPRPDPVRPNPLRPNPLRLRPRRRDDRILGPLVPVAFLDPPMLHRTAALLAEERRVPHWPATVREGLDAGPAGGPGAGGRWSHAVGNAIVQRLAVVLAGMPRPVRSGVCALLRRVLPDAGTGPEGAALTDWRWSVTATAATATGPRATATLEGTGHPGYTATAAMIAVVGLRLARPTSPVRSGCITPALALGDRPHLPVLATELTVRTSVEAAPRGARGGERA